MSKSKNHAYDDYDDYDDDEDYTRGKKLHKENRRSIKNWKKAWAQHENDYDELDDFYTKYNK